MLAELQRQLTAVYGLDAAHDVRDFLITDPVLAEILGNTAVASGAEETLLVCEEADGMSLSLFLDGDMLSRLESDNPLENLCIEHLDDFCKVLEGISHFNCMAWKAQRERTVSLLELELQGEIDKFISAMLLAEGQDNGEMLDGLHTRLFDKVSYRGDLNADAASRYRDANDYAARFCAPIRSAWRESGLPVDELRHFFRLQLQDKISFIHTRAWHA